MTAVSVVLATRDGAARLAHTLPHFQALEPPDGGWELIVVDNASTDGTSAVIDSFAGRLPLRRLSEPEPGQYSAINTAIGAANGALIVKTDDDAVPEPAWLRRLVAAAEAAPDFTVFGGAIAAEWPTDTPRWLATEAARGYFAITDPSQGAGPCAPNKPWGANIAFRRDIFDQGFRFDGRLGPRPGHYIAGGETEFSLRLAAYGHRAWFEPTARVRHIVRPEQLRAEWVFNRAFAFGRGLGFRAARNAAIGAPFYDDTRPVRPERMLRLIRRHQGLAMKGRRQGDAVQWVEGARVARWAAGVLYQWHLMRRNRTGL